MAITGAVGAALRQEAPYQAEIQMGAQLLLDFQGARNGGRRYYWYRGTRYRDWRKIPGLVYSCPSENIGDNADGSLVRAAPNELCLTDQGVSIWEARQNKVTIYNANPTSITGITRAGDVAATLTLVDDTAALTAAGLMGVVTSGQVFKVDNTAGTTSAFAIIPGAAGNTNIHTISAYARRVGSGASLIQFSSNGAAGAAISGAGYAKAIGTGVPVAASGLQVRVNAGDVVYFILPDLQEGAFSTPTIVTRGAAETRAQPSLTINGQAVILGQFKTNLVQWSTDGNNAQWYPIQGAKTAGRPDPFGGTGAVLWTADGTNNAHVFTASNASVNFISGRTYTLSRYVKAGTQQLLQMTGNNSVFVSGGYANFDVAAGVVTASAGLAAPPVIEPFVDGWWRIAITATATNTGLAHGGALVPITAPNSPRVEANTLTTNFLDYGAQVQFGAVMTPLIATGAAGGSVGDGFVVGIKAYLPANDGVQRFLVSLSDGTDGNRADIRRNTANALGGAILNNGVSMGYPATGGYGGARTIRASLRLRASSYRVTEGGVALASGAAAQAPPLDRIDLGRYLTGGDALNGYLATFEVYGDLNDNQQNRIAA